MPRLWGRGTPGHTVVAVLDQGEEPLVQDMGESGAGQRGGLLILIQSTSTSLPPSARAVGEAGSWSGHLATGDRVGAGYTLQVP